MIDQRFEICVTNSTSNKEADEKTQVNNKLNLISSKSQSFHL